MGPCLLPTRAPCRGFPSGPSCSSVRRIGTTQRLLNPPPRCWVAGRTKKKGRALKQLLTTLFPQTSLLPFSARRQTGSKHARHRARGRAGHQRHDAQGPARRVPRARHLARVFYRQSVVPSSLIPRIGALFAWSGSAGKWRKVISAPRRVDTREGAYHKGALVPAPERLRASVRWSTGECPERQRGRTVNPLAMPSQVRVLLPPPRYAFGYAWPET